MAHEEYLNGQDQTEVKIIRRTENAGKASTKLRKGEKEIVVPLNKFNIKAIKQHQIFVLRTGYRLPYKQTKYGCHS